jgi:hypothetical protein
VGFVADRVAGLLQVFQFPLPSIKPTVPHSSSIIIWGWYNRPVMAIVPLHRKKEKEYISEEYTAFIFRVKEKAEQVESVLSLTDYTALHTRRSEVKYYFSYLPIYILLHTYYSLHYRVNMFNKFLKYSLSASIHILASFTTECVT